MKSEESQSGENWSGNFHHCEHQQFKKATQHLQSDKPVSKVDRGLKHHFLCGSKWVAIQPIHQQSTEELETTSLLIALKSQACIRTESLAGMEGAILVLVAIYRVKLAENAFGVIAHERSQRTESTAVSFTVRAATCNTHSTAKKYNGSIINVKFLRLYYKMQAIGRFAKVGIYPRTF